jgi:hypothetical protein
VIVAPVAENTLYPIMAKIIEAKKQGRDTISFGKIAECFLKDRMTGH